MAVAVLVGTIAPAGAAPPQADRFRVVYRAPGDPQHAALYRELKAARLLEQVRGALGFVRLPRTVKLMLVDCDGDANAYYDPDDLSISVCYEYVQELRRLAAGPGRPPGVTPENAVRSKVLEIFLHEAGHALIDLLRIPVIGGQEEAADVFANLMIVGMPSRTVRETVMGIAWMYAQEADEEGDAPLRVADTHPLPRQRYYNCLCLAYGAKPRLFPDLVLGEYLPTGRAETCQDEYRRAADAAARLMGPYLEPRQRERLFAHAPTDRPTHSGARRPRR